MGELNNCCRQEENLSPPHETDKPDLTYRVCRICGGRHFELVVDPLVIGVAPAEITA